MSLLAYHVGRLTHLEVSLRRSLDELSALSVSDPAAADALRATRNAATQIEQVWLPLVRRILATDPLSHDARRRAGVGSLDQSLVTVMVGAYGWEAQHDLLSDDTSTVTVEEARALGARLNDLTLDLDDPEQLEWLAQQLAIIGRDPALSAAFLANFHDWAELCDHLAARHALLLSDTPHSSPTSVAAIDAVFSGLGSIARYGLPTTGCPLPSTVLPQIDEMRPYSAALVVQYVGLQGELLAQVSVHLLQRWLTMPWQANADEAPTDVHFSGPNTADVLFALMLADPVAAAHFVTRAVEDPDVLFRTADDALLPQQLLLAVTDPANASAAEAGAVIVPLLSYFADGGPLLQPGHEGYSDTWPLFLVDLISPWMLQLSTRNDEFGVSDERIKVLLASVLDDSAALDRLVANVAVVQAGVIAELSTDGGMESWTQFCAFVGLLTQLVMEEKVRDEESAQAAFDFVVNLVSAATVFIPGGRIATTLLIEAGNVVADEFDISLNPFDPADVAADAEYGTICMLSTAAAAVALALYQQWVADGWLPAGFPPPPLPDKSASNPGDQLLEDFDEWSADLPVVDGMVLADRFDAVVGKMLSVSQAAAHT